MKSVSKAITDRRAINFFDPAATVSKSDVEKILELASLAPSSNNSQPWLTYTVMSPEKKKELRAACMGQPKVENAAAVIVITADLTGAEKNAPILAEKAIEQGFLTADNKETFIKAISNTNGTPGEQSRLLYSMIGSSLFAMNLMLAAQELNIESHPLRGIDEKQVKNLLGISNDEIVVLVICLGQFANDKTLRPRAYRKPPSDFNKYF